MRDAYPHAHFQALMSGKRARHSFGIPLFAAAILVSLLVYPADSASQTAGGGAGAPPVPSGPVPADTPVHEINAAAEHKFEHGFYEKIRGLIQEPPPDGDSQVYDGTRY